MFSFHFRQLKLPQSLVDVRLLPSSKDNKYRDCTLALVLLVLALFGAPSVSLAQQSCPAGYECARVQYGTWCHNGTRPSTAPSPPNCPASAFLGATAGGFSTEAAYLAYEATVNNCFASTDCQFLPNDPAVPGWTNCLPYGPYLQDVECYQYYNKRKISNGQFLGTATRTRARSWQCPAGYYYLGSTYLLCGRRQANSCPLTSNPVSLPRGTKLQTEPVYAATSASPLGLSWTYHYFGFADWVISTGPEQFRGRYWFHTYDRVLWSNDPVTPTSVVVRRPDGMTEGFVASGANFVTNGDSTSVLTALRNAANQITGWRLELAGDQVEEYDVTGRLIRLSDRTDRVQTLAYNAQGRLASVTDQRGRQLSFGYNPDGRIDTLTTPDGVYGFLWDGLNLTKIVFPGAVNKTYHYENTAQPNAMTGVTDERGLRWSTYAYRADGFMQSTSMAGGVNTVNYNFTQSGGAVSSVAVTNPLGLVTTYGMINSGGKIKLSSVNNPCPNCGDSKIKSYVYDSTGKIDTQTDFRNQVTDIDYNTRALEIRRIDAKQTSVGVLNPERRITETDWHPSFRVPTQRRVCAANTANTCTVSATAPNLISKTVMTYNARGQLLTSTQTDPANAANTRVITNTYCDAINATDCPLVGLLKTTDGARTDVSDITTYSYRMVDAADLSYRKGDVWTITNPLNQVVEFLAYDAAGRQTKMKDPNGIETWMTYHPRGWLATRTIKGQVPADDATTTFAYTPFGAIERVTQADGAYVQYGYDGAQRLTTLTDNAGNTITYTLDAAGNRIGELSKDSGAAIKRSLQREFDQLSRLKASLRAGVVVGDPNTKKTNYTYDPNSNTDLVTDPNIGVAAGTVTDNDYDALNRLIKSIQDVGGIAAKVEYGYDALDRLTLVKDPKNLNTTYQYDGLGNLKQLSSPDTGTTLYPVYDAAGNRREQIDARGVKSAMTYDVLNRLTKIDYTPAGSTVVNAAKTVQFYYDEPNTTTNCPASFPQGKLTRFTDESGSTTLCYDRRGNVIRKTQVTGSTTLTLVMGYNSADRLTSMTYPTGTAVSYGRDSQGRIVSVSINATPFITGVSYLPFGPISQISFANGKTLSKTYDQNYDIDTIISTATGGLNLDYTPDEVGNIKAINQSGTTFNLGYDKLYRLNSVKDQNQVLIEGFTYDATGNRLSKQNQTGAPVPYTYASTNHRLTNAGDGVRTFDANGNTQNTTQAGTLSYDERNRLTTTVLVSGVKPNQITTTNSYLFNARGERVQTSQNGLGAVVFKPFLYDEVGKLLATGTSKNADEVIYLDAMPVARVQAGSILPIETDHLGTPRVIQDATGSSTTWTWNLLSNTATGSNAFGEQASNGSDFNLRFPGQYADGNGLSYNYFRDYEPGTGRYVESDPIGLRGGLSTFGYVGNNPHGGLDFFGLAKTVTVTEKRLFRVQSNDLCMSLRPELCKSENLMFLEFTVADASDCCVLLSSGSSSDVLSTSYDWIYNITSWDVIRWTYYNWGAPPDTGSSCCFCTLTNFRKVKPSDYFSPKDRPYFRAR